MLNSKFDTKEEVFCNYTNTEYSHLWKNGAKSYSTADNNMDNGLIIIIQYDKEAGIIEGIFRFRVKDLQNPQDEVVANDSNFSCKKF